MFRKASVFLVLFSLIINIALPVTVHAEGEDLITAPHGVLMEASTGTIIYEKDKDTKVYPASITKIMTLVLIFDEIAKGTLHMEDEVTTSAYAKSMGGSQVYLEEGEKQTVETMIKTGRGRELFEAHQKIYEMMANKVTDNLNTAVRKTYFADIPFTDTEE